MHWSNLVAWLRAGIFYASEDYSDYVMTAVQFWRNQQQHKDSPATVNCLLTIKQQVRNIEPSSKSYTSAMLAWPSCNCNRADPSNEVFRAGFVVMLGGPRLPGPLFDLLPSLPSGV